MSRGWTGPEKKRLELMARMGHDIGHVCDELVRTKGSIKAMCIKLDISIRGMHAKVGQKRDWQNAYDHGKRAKTRACCPYPRSDMYHFCAWQAGYSDRRMYG